MASERNGHLPEFESFGTTAIHAGQEPEKFKHWPCVPPISLATTFKQPSPGETMGFEYSRGGNPTRQCLEEAFAAICGGTHAFTWASGLAGTQAVLQLLRAGDGVLAIDDLYGGTNRMLRRIAAPMGIEFHQCPTYDPEAFANAMKPNTKLVWIESPTNPLLQVTDIRKVAQLVKARGAILVVDNTFMTSYLQRPLELGADIEFASVTKYYNGHSDVLMGLTVTKNDGIAEKLQFIQFAAGAVPSPFDCFLVNRGLKTLHLRMERHSQNAMAVARYLEAHPKVTEVLFPGLPSHPNHEVAKAQSTGFSGMVSFRIDGGLDQSKIFLKSVKIFTLAESLGAVESLAELPAIMTHASVPPEQRAELGISDSLIRLSCGCENTIDLLNDLKQALNAAIPGRRGNEPSVADFVNIPASHNASKGSVSGSVSSVVARESSRSSGTETPRRRPPTSSVSPFATMDDQPAAHYQSSRGRAPSSNGVPFATSNETATTRPASSRNPPGGVSSLTFG